MIILIENMVKTNEMNSTFWITECLIIYKLIG